GGSAFGGGCLRRCAGRDVRRPLAARRALAAAARQKREREREECRAVFQARRHLGSTPLHEGARLHYVDLPLHVDPLYVLLLPAEYLAYERGRASKPPHNVVGEHRALARYGNLFDSSALVECEETVLFGARKDFDGVCARQVYDLLGDFLALDHFDAEAPLGADVDRAAIVRVERVGRNHHARAVGVDALLHEHAHEGLRVVNVRALARLVSLEVPERRPHGLYSFEQLLVATDVRHCVVESSAVEVREVFDVRGASDEQPLARVLRMNLLQYGLA